jgi:hypothetical protein
MRPFHSHRPTTSCGLRPGNRRANSGIILSIAFMQVDVASWSPVLAACRYTLDAVQSVLLNWSSVYFDTSAVNAWWQNVIASVADAGPAASRIKIASACFMLPTETIHRRGRSSGLLRYRSA